MSRGKATFDTMPVVNVEENVSVSPIVDTLNREIPDTRSMNPARSLDGELSSLANSLEVDLVALRPHRREVRVGGGHESIKVKELSDDMVVEKGVARVLGSAASGAILGGTMGGVSAGKYSKEKDKKQNVRNAVTHGIILGALMGGVFNRNVPASLATSAMAGLGAGTETVLMKDRGIRQSGLFRKDKGLDSDLVVKELSSDMVVKESDTVPVGLAIRDLRRLDRMTNYLKKRVPPEEYDREFSEPEVKELDDTLLVEKGASRSLLKLMENRRPTSYRGPKSYKDAVKWTQDSRNDLARARREMNRGNPKYLEDPELVRETRGVTHDVSKRYGEGGKLVMDDRMYPYTTRPVKYPKLAKELSSDMVVEKGMPLRPNVSSSWDILKRPAKNMATYRAAKQAAKNPAWRDKMDIQTHGSVMAGRQSRGQHLTGRRPDSFDKPVPKDPMRIPLGKRPGAYDTPIKELDDSLIVSKTPQFAHRVKQTVTSRQHMKNLMGTKGFEDGMVEKFSFPKITSGVPKGTDKFPKVISGKPKGKASKPQEAKPKTEAPTAASSSQTVDAGPGATPETQPKKLSGFTRNALKIGGGGIAGAGLVSYANRTPDIPEQMIYQEYKGNMQEKAFAINPQSKPTLATALAKIASKHSK